MSQLSVSGNQGQISNISTDKIEGNKSDVLDDIKQEFDKETSLEKMEELGGPRPPKPESTMHKVGRFLTGILGGLLLAAGVAAAVAATVASCGLAAGVVAGVAATVVGAVGVTGASVIAGAAGAAGIGLIAGSHAMKPKNPEALLQTQQAAKQEMPDEVQLTEIGADEADTIAEALKTNHGIDVTEFEGNEHLLTKTNRDTGITFLLNSNISLKGGDVYGTVGRSAKDNVVQFVSNALTLFGVDSEKAQSTPENVLLVRYAIDNYFKAPSAILDDDALNALNNDAVKKDLNEMIESEMSFMPVKTESYHMLAIFRDALNLKSVPKPQQNPVIQNDLGINLISNPEEKNVSLGNKKPDLSKILPKKISFTEEAEKPIVDALSEFGEWNNSLTDDCRDYISLLFSDIEKNENGTIKSLDEGIINKFVKSVLNANDTDKIELNAKNVLLVRYNIITYFEQFEGQYKDIYNDLNSPEGRKPYVEYLQNALKNETNPDTVTGIRIFIAALTETDLSKLDASPLPPLDIKA